MNPRKAPTTNVAGMVVFTAPTCGAGSRLMRGRLALSVMLAAVMLVVSATREVAAQPTVPGVWETLPYTTPINPIHVAVLRTGKVLIVAGSENDETKTTYRAAVWDRERGTFAVQDIPWDLFCNGMSFLADGRVFITGGNDGYPAFRGIPTTAIFDPATERFIQVHDMARGRWYPTNTSLADGSTLTFSGTTQTGAINDAVEFYDVGFGWSPEFHAPWRPPTYPRLHLLPSGQVFYSGMTPQSRLFDPAIAGGTPTWSSVIARMIYPNDRWAGSSVLLPLTPANGYAPRVMTMGGDNPATATAEIIDLAVPIPQWRALPPMSAPRIEMNAVILPTGKILAQGGSAIRNTSTTASLAADLFDPVTETWSAAGVAAYPRMYHSVALLLPDATVWTAGSNPSGGMWEPRMEIYSPAYLFTTDAEGRVVRAPRPSITRLPPVLGYGASFHIDSPDAGDITSIALVRPGANTHAFDMEQRLVSLTFTHAAGGGLTVTSPPNANIAPPGYYMLFLVNARGVPSVAKFIQLSPSPTNTPPKATIVSPPGDAVVDAGVPIGFAGSANDPDGAVTAYSWVFPGGSPGTSTAQAPGTVTFSTAGTYVVSLTVTDNAGANDPSPPTRTITIKPTAAMTSPVEGSTVSGPVVVDMRETGGSGSLTWTVRLDDKATPIFSTSWTGSTASFTWDTSTVSPGAHTLSLMVQDGRGHTATATRNLTVVAPPRLTVSPESVAPDASVTAAWSGILSPSPSDWIGLYAPGAADGSGLNWLYVSCSQSAGVARASGSCSFRVPGSLSAGTYELRLFAANGFTRLATSPTFTVTAAGSVGTGTVTLSASPSSVVAGAPVTAVWSSIATPIATDWIGLYAPSAPDGSALNWLYVGCSQSAGVGRASGSCSLTVPASVAAATYELRLFAANGFTRLAKSATFTVTAGSGGTGGTVTLSASPASVGAGAPVTAAWSGIATPIATDWIGLYAPSGPDGSALTWLYVGCAQSTSVARASGSCSLTIPASVAAGTYELRLFAANGFTRLAKSPTFTVTTGSGGTGGTVTLSASPASVTAGASVTATWNGIVTATATDWIGLYAPSAPDGSALTWLYVGCAQSTAAARAGGSCPVAVPPNLAAGTYELRLFAANGFTRLATSNPFTITNNTATTISVEVVAVGEN
jgi:galactose oxidase-like protein/PKD domain-containing protein